MTGRPSENGDARAAVFSSQRDWLRWLDSQRPSSVKAVKSMTLRLTDIDLSPLLDQDRREPVGAWQLYQRELAALDRALALLPGLVHLRVVPPAAANSSQLMRGMYVSFLKLLPRRLPELRRLDIDDSDAVLALVPALNEIAEVHFAGSTARTAVRPPPAAPARTMAATSRAYPTPSVVSYASDSRASVASRAPVRTAAVPSVTRPSVRPRPT